MFALSEVCFFSSEGSAEELGWDRKARERLDMDMVSFVNADQADRSAGLTETVTSASVEPRPIRRPSQLVLAAGIPADGEIPSRRAVPGRRNAGGEGPRHEIEARHKPPIDAGELVDQVGRRGCDRHYWLTFGRSR